jgi:predicted DNA-binding transcriptional regulator YafY
MDRTERFYKIDQLLHDRRSVPMAALIEELGISKATVKRDLEYMRDRLNAPISYDYSLRGYCFDKSLPGAEKYNLPGLWFNDQEIFALLTMHQMLSNLGNGLITPHIKPLLARLNALLGSQDDSAEEIRKRIRILHMAARTERPEHFETAASATIRRRRLKIAYHARSSDEATEREVSPQRLVHYRDNWYLDGWCHLRDGLRSFSVDAIKSAEMLNRKAKPVAEKTLNEVLESSYGIFSGKADKRARLRFTPKQARWVASEQWHPEQVSQFAVDGSYLLEFPYSNDGELVMDILRYGPDVEVLGPASLRRKVKARLEEAAGQYR